MTDTVWKFLISPKGTEIQGTPIYIGLDPRMQAAAIWCLCDPDDPGELRPMPYVIVMTGEPVPDDAGEYVTTVAGIEGWCVAHFFHRKNAPEDQP